MPAPRKRTQPTKPRAPSKKKVISQPKVEVPLSLTKTGGVGKRTGRSVSNVTGAPRRGRQDPSRGPVLPFTHARVVEEKSV